MMSTIFRFVLVLLGILGFVVVVLIPWIIGIGEVMSMIRNKDWWYYRK